MTIIQKGEPMDDLISRQAALDAMETWDKFGCDPDGKLVRYDDDKHYIPYVHYEDMVHAIKHLPSAQPGWIPCDVRTPKHVEESYWICTDTGYQCQCRWTNNVFGLGARDEWGWKLLDIPQYSKVVAWQPLPTPYREGGQDGKN